MPRTFLKRSGVFFVMPDDRVPLAEVSVRDDKAAGIEPQKPLAPDHFIDKMGFLDDIEYHRMADQLDVSYEDRKGTKIASEMDYLYEWAQDVTGSEDRMEILEHLEKTKRGLGINDRGKPLIKALYEFARLEADRKRIEKKIGLIKEKHNIYGRRQT